MALEEFERAGERLRSFEKMLKGTAMENHNALSIDLYLGELKELWAKVKSTYETTLVDETVISTCAEVGKAGLKDRFEGLFRIFMNCGTEI